jgi:hypothetical protein
MILVLILLNSTKILTKGLEVLQVATEMFQCTLFFKNSKEIFALMRMMAVPTAPCSIKKPLMGMPPKVIALSSPLMLPAVALDV